jgi:hypothetical protein
MKRDDLPESDSRPSNQLQNVSPILLTLDLLFSLRRLALRIENFMIDKLPWQFAPSIQTPSLVMPPQPFFQIGGVADVITGISFASI